MASMIGVPITDEYPIFGYSSLLTAVGSCPKSYRRFSTCTLNFHLLLDQGAPNSDHMSLEMLALAP